MNYLYILLASVVLTFSGASLIPHTELEKAFESNEASTVIDLSKDKVLMTILGKEGVYAKPQAKLILKDFFTSNPKGSFEFIFKGKESSSDSFSIGNYKVKNDVFRVTFHFKKVGSTFLIETLNIEK
jgi:Domain of unknown function (DUF4783)